MKITDICDFHCGLLYLKNSEELCRSNIKCIPSATMEISPVLVLLVLFWATGYHTSQWVF